MNQKARDLYQRMQSGDTTALQKIVSAAYRSTPTKPARNQPTFESVVDAAMQFADKTPLVRTVDRFFLQPTIGFTWEPHCAEDLDDFLYEKYDGDDKKIKARIGELEEGAEPTEDERQELEEWYEDGEGYSDNPTYYLLKVTLPAASQEPQPIYLLSARAETGQYSDQTEADGPFTSLDAVVQCVRGKRTFDTICVTSYVKHEEANAFQEKIAALGVTVSNS